MKNYGLNQLREMYLEFFESKGHLRMQSFPLVPQNDPSILLINAGMTPLKPYFSGKEIPPRNRVTTCQKCIRTPDIENVGKTARHGTFFEMLGNFSFGDYFKTEAIQWAWEFFTGVLEIPVERLFVSVYVEDDEAYNIWRNEVGLSESKIFRMGKEDNFWEHGTGPCGPCSEIYFDRGEDKGCGSAECTVGCECDRFIEVWNLVFTQFDKQKDGSYELLAKKNIDTGMGLERLACVMQDVDNIFEVDTIKNVLLHVCKISGKAYGKSYGQDISIRVITDHIRSTSMMISDGVLPSNEGRGYVLRRLLRRAARHGKLLGIEGLFLEPLVDTVIDECGKAYPHMEEKRAYIKKVVSIEEQKFNDTVEQGTNILNQFIEQVKGENKTLLSGEMVFKLHDTFGFPMDLTREIAQENGLSIDDEGFKNEMKAQKDKARDAFKSREGSAWEKDMLEGVSKELKTEFVGYTKYSEEAEVLYIISEGEIVEAVQQDESAIVILDKTPFYAESGGQSGDSGLLKNSQAVLKVTDCKKTPDGKYLHYASVVSGVLEKGNSVVAEIDMDKRMATERNHTLTHLLQKALKNTLGDHVNQSGSLVTPDRLRFDFTHFSSIDAEQLAAIEQELNERILENLEVKTAEMSIEDARKLGAMALFGEKYGDVVRVVTVGDYSMELCGGTHLKSTAQAGLIKILSESGIAAGVRRIEALTGKAALQYYKHQERMVNEISSMVKANPEDASKKIELISIELKKANKEIETLRSKLVSNSVNDVIDNAEEINGSKIIAVRFDHLDMNGLRATADSLKDKIQSGVIALATTKDDKVNFVVTATKDLVQKGIHSGNIIREVAKATGGGGGGRPDMAQAGGKDISKVDEALKLAIELIKEKL